MARDLRPLHKKIKLRDEHSGRVERSISYYFFLGGIPDKLYFIYITVEYDIFIHNHTNLCFKYVSNVDQVNQNTGSLAEVAALDRKSVV